jgi:dipeptidyl aminopeptidase/acylaminoacyl peptidase
MNKSKNSQVANHPNKLQRRLEVLLVIAAILILALTACAPALTPMPTGTFIPTTVVPTSTSTELPVTATATLTVAQEPPPCTFPLAQITTTESAPANYTFSDPQVVLTAPKGNLYSIAQWLPDNQQVLMTEALYSATQSGNNTPTQESIKLYNPGTGESKVYATRPFTHELPSWNPALNAVIYPVTNSLGLDQSTRSYKFTRQVWISYGNPATAQKLDDNLPQLSFAIRPGGSQTLYFSDKQIDELDASLNELPSIPFDSTQWDYAKERRNSYPVSYETAWQPGTSLVFLYSAANGGGGYTFILNADTGRVCELNLGGWAEVARWSSDGRYLAFIRSTKYWYPTYSADLAVLDTITGKVTMFSVMPQETEGLPLVYNSVWAPDNRHLLAVGNIWSQDEANNLQGLYLVDVISGQSVNVLPDYNKFFEGGLAWSPDGSKLVIRCPTNIVDRICFISVQKSGQ